MLVNDCLFEDWMATYHPPRIPGRSPFFAVKHASIAFAFEALECPNAQDTPGRPVAAIGHFYEDLMATSHLLVFWKGRRKLSNTSVPPDKL